MTDDKDDLIRQLTIRLRETVDENDKLRALVERLTEGASAHATLQELHRNRDLPAAIRAKAAIGCLGVETAPLKPVAPAVDSTCEEIEPLADLITRQRARMEAMHAAAQDIEISPSGIVKVLPKPGGNGGDD
jgi:hypothetical protein